MSAPPQVELSGVEKRYRSGELDVVALSAVNLTIKPGEFTVFSGPSGSGKTTLLNLVGLLDVPTAGRIHLEGRDVSTLSSALLGEVRAARQV